MTNEANILKQGQYNIFCLASDWSNLARKTTDSSSSEKECTSAMSHSKWNRISSVCWCIKPTAKTNYIFISFDHSYCIWIKQNLPICTLTCEHVLRDYLYQESLEMSSEVSNILVFWIWTLLLTQHIIIRNNYIRIAQGCTWGCT